MKQKQLTFFNMLSLTLKEYEGLYPLFIVSYLKGSSKIQVGFSYGHT